MLTFKEHVERQKQLTEGLVRTGLIAKKTADASAEGKQARRQFRAATGALERPVDGGDEDARMERLEKSMANIAAGLDHQTNQITHSTSANAVGHLLRDKLLKDIMKRLAKTGGRK
ncbi:hypothetical protein [Thalassovita sp.]|uniref:hypothetical protein n=1 Tax=Thalassovita sp. TaxID=1979401 RepID=UPI002B26863C|nr:hypothetical protein [Thalassovita sp.]